MMSRHLKAWPPLRGCPEFDCVRQLYIRPVTGCLIMIGDMTRGYYAADIALSSKKVL